MERTLVEPLIGNGSLPNLGAIRDRAVRCRLRNIREYRSELPYTQLLTGKGGAANRYWTTVSFDPATYEVAAVGALDAPPFYALGPGTKVIQFDVPHSVLADDVDGIQITGWGCHSPQYPRAARPAGLLREIDARFGAHPASGNDYEPGWYEPDYLHALSEALTVGAHRRVDVVGWLQEQLPDWELLLTVMSEAHSAGHQMWHGIDVDHPLHTTETAEVAGARLVEIYRAVDAAVGRLVDGLPSDSAVIVFALHGMQPNDNDLPSLVLLPELLHRLWRGRRLLRDGDQTRWAAGGYEPLVPARHRRWLAEMQAAFAGRFRDDPTHWIRRHIPERLLHGARRAAGRSDPPVGELGWPVPPETELPIEEIRQWREHLRWQVPTWYRRHWPAMPAFVLPTFSDAHVRINVHGRERHGIVPPDRYRAVGEEVIDIVRRCRDPRTGEPVLEDVVWTHGGGDPFDPVAPDADLVLLWRRPVDALEHPDVGVVGPFPFMRTGNHSSNGFAYVTAPGLEAADIGQRSALDMTPTILHLLGQRPRTDMEGTSLIGGSLAQPVSADLSRRPEVPSVGGTRGPRSVA
jgi:predicted AlkP superfamily phosphohydrolase/phosphomutase